ncbi:lipocalin family protein [Flavimarina sp. Hel_I_48]|uniref:lipocalin family protein n=1 Tax=Flavimarina sp. Hel_I_48 TaxID=1392488 RepID=UPI0004DF3213|nr:lipocalin family protein [Flavimarina sp. Hel_I_48]
MKKVQLYGMLFGLVLFTACGGNSPEEQKDFLNGYWEIQRVDSPYGNDKDYSISETIDYIEIEDSTGFRAKVLPRLDGTIITNGNTEDISVSIKDDSLRLEYTTAYDQWTETVLEANEENLKVKNQKGMIYTYSRHKLIDLREDGLLQEE